MSEIADFYGVWDKAFVHFNEKIFDGELQCPVFTVAKTSGSHGYFHASQWLEKGTQDVRHQITMDVNSLNREDIAIMGTFVHELTHLWQQQCGKPGRGKYHNTEWANKMRSIGLNPRSRTSKNGTGDKVTHDIADEGPFMDAWKEWEALDVKVRWGGRQGLMPQANVSIGGETPAPVTRNRKTKYVHVCDSGEKMTLWGKPEMEVFCGCGDMFEEAG